MDQERREFLRGTARGVRAATYNAGDRLSNDWIARFRLPLAAFRQGLSETGYAETENVAIQYSWAAFQYDWLPAMAGDLVHRPVNAIATIGGTPEVGGLHHRYECRAA